MYKPTITRVLLRENPHYIIATVYYSGNSRRTYRRKRDGDYRPLPKTVRSFMHSPDVGVSFTDHGNTDHSKWLVPWKQWIYAKIR